MNVLVVEDGSEYVDTLGRFLRDGFAWTRAGCGAEALAALGSAPCDAVFLDMRFDRCPADRLLGNLEHAIDRFNGDPIQARRFLEDHQGAFILAAIREAGHRTPVLVSYDFGGEPRRWERIAVRQAPVAWVPGNAGPGEIAAALRELAAR
jgi:CheY-like chemotaxis protein